MKSFATLIGLIAVLLSCPALRAGEDPEALYAQVMSEIRAAERKLAEAEEDVAKQAKIEARAQAAYAQAQKTIQQRAQARRAALARREAQENIQDKALLRLQETIENLEIDIGLWAREAREKQDAAERKRLEERVRQMKANLALLKRQYERESQARGLTKASRDKAKHEAEQATDRYWQARKDGVKPYTNWLAERIRLEVLQAHRQQALDALRQLQTDAPERLAAVTPPMLLEVVARDAQGQAFYDARWADEKDRLAIELEVCAVLISGQEQSLAKWRAKRDATVKALGEAALEFDARLRYYQAQIKREAWKRGLIECLDSAATILLDNPANWEFNLFFEAFWRVGASVTGLYKPEYTFPTIDNLETGALPSLNPPTETASKTSMKETLQAFIKATTTRMIEGRVSSRMVRESLQPEIEVLADEATAGVLQKSVLRRPLSEVTLRDVAAGLRELKDLKKYRGFWKEFQGKIRAKEFRRGLARELGKAVVQEYIKQELMAMAKEGRKEAFLAMHIAGLEMNQADLMIRQTCAFLRFEERKLAVLNEIRRDLLAERDQAQTARLLVARIDRPCTRAPEPFSLGLRFTRPVDVTALRLGGNSLAAPSNAEEVVTVQARSDAVPDRAQLFVDAKDHYAQKQLDAFPGTIARHGSLARAWLGYEAGADEEHELHFGPQSKAGLSMVLLFDCSGSMADGGKLGDAKAAARALLKRPDLLHENDEVAIWNFYHNTPRRLLAFTGDHARVEQMINALQAEGGTPLGLSIRHAGTYLVARAHHAKKVLVVLSDGMETCGDDPQLAIEAIRSLAAKHAAGVDIQKEGW